LFPYRANESVVKGDYNCAGVDKGTQALIKFETGTKSPGAAVDENYERAVILRLPPDRQIHRSLVDRVSTVTDGA
jgi:hypothetical protein